MFNNVSDLRLWVEILNAIAFVPSWKSYLLILFSRTINKFFVIILIKPFSSAVEKKFLGKCWSHYASRWPVLLSLWFYQSKTILLADNKVNIHFVSSPSLISEKLVSWSYVLVIITPIQTLFDPFSRWHIFLVKEVVRCQNILFPQAWKFIFKYS